MSKTEVGAKLYPERSVYDVLGNLCNNPELLRQPEINLESNDFYKSVHRITFSAINNLIMLSPDRENISAIEIENYLAETPNAYKKWNDYRGFEYIEKAIEHSEKESFKLNYDRLKKFSLLRSANENGFDVSELYDYNSYDLEDIDKSMIQIDNMSTSDILDFFTLKIMGLKEQYVDATDTLTYHMGDDIENIIERIREEPMYGYPFYNKFYNTFFKGALPGKLLLRSADSGDGKTRNNLRDLAYMTMDQIWCDKTNKFVENPFTMAGLYIGTEEMKTQTQTTMLSIVSGIEQDVLESGLITPELRDRVDKAQKIIKSSKLYAHRDDDFSIDDIEMTIEKFIIEKNVFPIVFDYIQITPKISKSVKKDFGYIRDEWDILEYFSTKLKDIAEKYEVFIMSGTQLNRNHKNRENRDASSLAGGSATQNKVDFGVQLYKPTQEDFKGLEHILSTGEYEKPNYSHWVYKNRSGKYDRHIIWTRINMGNMREKELFVTDYDYNLIEVPLTEIDLVDGEKNITTENTGGYDIKEVEDDIPF